MHIRQQGLHSKRQLKRAGAVLAALALVAGGTSTISAAVGTTENTLMVTAEPDLSQATRLSHAELAGEVFIFIQNSSGSIQEVQYFLDDGIGTGSPISIATTGPFVLAPSGGAAQPAPIAGTAPSATQPTTSTQPPDAGTEDEAGDDGEANPDSGTSEDEDGGSGEATDESENDSDMRSFSRNANSGGDSKDSDEDSGSGGQSTEGESDESGSSGDGGLTGEISEIGGTPGATTGTTGGTGGAATTPGAPTQTGIIPPGSSTTATPGASTPGTSTSGTALNTTQLTDGTHFVMAQLTSTTGKVTDLFARFQVSNGGTAAVAPPAESETAPTAAPSETETATPGASTSSSAPIPTSGNVVWSTDFESEGGWGDAQLVGSAEPFTLVPDPAGGGGNVGKFTINGGGERNEIIPDAPKLNNGDTYTFAFSMYLEDGFPVDASGWDVLTQWKNDGTGSPPLSLGTGGGQFSLGGGYMVGATFSENLGPAVTGQWINWVFTIEFVEGGGTVDVWMDGQQVLSGFSPGGGTLYPGLSSYLKTGYYRDTAISETGTVYYDNWSVTQG